MNSKSGEFVFKRGLNDSFMEQLGKAAASGGWFADVLADADLILGVRGNYLDVYYRGQALFKVELKRGDLKVSTHPKYLLDPDLKKAVVFNGKSFAVEPGAAMLRTYRDGTLARMKRAANLYTGAEKEGLQQIIKNNANVIDTEVTFSNDADSDKRTDRIDIAALVEHSDGVELRFWEAKCFSNKELRAKGSTAPPVFKQIEGYRKLVHRHRVELEASYRTVASNLATLASWSSGKRSAGKLTQRVADGAAFSIAEPPHVGLLIYDFDEAQRDHQGWKEHLDKLGKVGVPVISAGDPKNIKLNGTLRLSASA